MLAASLHGNNFVGTFTAGLLLVLFPALVLVLGPPALAIIFVLTCAYYLAFPRSGTRSDRVPNCVADRPHSFMA